MAFTQTGRIHGATYEYAWYTIEPKAAKCLMLIMLRSNKPLYLTAGKIFPMTMATLCNVSFKNVLLLQRKLLNML